MTVSTESDLRELKDLINARFNELDKKFEAGFNELDKKFEAGFNELDKKLDVYTAKTDEKLEAIKQNLTQLNERVGKIEDTKEKQIWTLITILGGSVLTVALKFVLSGNNP